MIVQHDARAFHLPATIEPVPALLDRVTALVRDDRPGPALAEALAVLRRHPRDADAFRCALVVCGGRASRSGGEREPVTEAQLRDPLLAPIRTVCTRCQDVWWFSDHELLTRDYRLTVVNPIGLQCQRCRYTLCRNCLTGQRGCPQSGCGGELGTPVLATGLPAVPLEHVVLLGEHTSPPPSELAAILDAVEPGTDWTGVPLVPVGPPPNGADDEFGLFVVAQLESDGRITAGALDRVRMLTVERPGLGLVRVYLVAAGSRRRWRFRPGGRR